MPLGGDQINPDLIHAIVAIEDSRFYEHAGVDWRSAMGAAWEDLHHLSIRRGASTLSMQLARLRDPVPRSFVGKLEQAIHAEQIERHLDKRAILVEYLNRAPFGGNLVGAGAASWRYFDKPCRQLSLAQCALLAGLPQSPNRLRPDRYPQAARLRRDRVLDRMLALAMISRQRYDEAVAEPVDAKWIALPQSSPEIREGALAPLATMAQAHRGQTLRTTIDSTIQRQATRAAKQRLDLLTDSGVGASAVVVLDTHSAELLATVSVSEDARGVDLTRCARSTGSTLKPFIYAAAFDAGVCTPQTQLTDAPAAWPGYEPANYDRQFRGEISAAEALAQSRNLPATTVLSRVGVSRCVDVMGAIGLRTLSRTPDRFGIPLAIGGAEATPMELAEAYATLARGGKHREITYFSSTGFQPVHPAGHGLESRATEEIDTTLELDGHSPAFGINSDPPLLLRDACYAALGAIADRDRTARLCPEAVNSNVAWKTGTSSGHRDAWCAAVTRRFTIVVWLGNTRGRGSSALVGADAAAPLALQLIAALDPVDEPWPASDLHESPTRFQTTQSRPTIVWPADGSELIVTGEPQQNVELRAGPDRSAGDPRISWWFIDGTQIGKGNSIEWTATLGRHEVRLLDDGGHSAVAHFRVR